MRAPLLLVATVLLAAGCGGQETKDGVVQTKMPGAVTAGGRTSGEVMAANAPAAGVVPGPAGTPGIPGGAEGNPGGANLGSTAPKTTDIAATSNAPAGPASAPAATTAASPPGTPPTAAAGAASAPVAAAPLSPASAAALEAQRAQQALERAQDVVAAHWRARSATQPATATNAPLNPPPAQIVIRSEKLGTAPPSRDVKTPTKPKTDPIVDPKSPRAAGEKP